MTIKTIAVDLTPVLPGGDNGGAKIFVLALIVELSKLAPDCQFVLLTQQSSHDELASLDSRNVRRVMIRPGRQVVSSASFRSIVAKLVRRLPQRLTEALVYPLSRFVRRRDANSVVRSIEADLLFCPFTAPIYHEVGIPTVCTVYDLQFEAYPQFFAAEDVAHRARSFKEAVKLASGIAAISEFSRVSAIKSSGMSPERIVAIPLRMAQRLQSIDSVCLPALDRFGLVRERYFVYPANFWRHKNHEMLLTAFCMARAQGLAADIKLVLTGAPGARQRAILDAAHGLGLDRPVQATGYLSDRELSEVVAGSMAVVFPSLYEGFGLPVLEAMAVGKPVACSTLTSLPEVAHDAALLFDPRVPEEIANSMLRLSTDSALTQKLVEAGLARAREFSDSARMARDYWELFQDARRNAKLDTMIQGIHADGWAGPRVVLYHPSTAEGALELDVDMPQWHPRDRINVAVSVRAEGKQRIELARGERRTLRLKVGAEKRILIDFSPTFQPSADGMGDDERSLAVLVARAELVDAAGNRNDLLESVKQ